MAQSRDFSHMITPDDLAGESGGMAKLIFR